MSINKPRRKSDSLRRRATAAKARNPKSERRSPSQRFGSYQPRATPWVHRRKFTLQAEGLLHIVAACHNLSVRLSSILSLAQKTVTLCLIPRSGRACTPILPPFVAIADAKLIGL